LSKAGGRVLNSGARGGLGLIGEAIEIRRHTFVRVRALGYLAGGSYAFRALIVGEDGGVNQFEVPFVMTAIDTELSVVVELPVGWLVSCSVVGVTGLSAMGSVYVVVEVGLQVGAGFVAAGVLYAGYPSSLLSTGFPLAAPVPGNTVDVGVIDVGVADPAPGLPVVFGFILLGVRELVSAQVTLSTSATVANRQVFVELSGVTSLAGRWYCSQVHAASSVFTYTLSATGADVLPPGSRKAVLIPRLGWSRGALLNVSADNLQAGDQFSGAVFAFRPGIGF